MALVGESDVKDVILQKLILDRFKDRDDVASVIEANRKPQAANRSMRTTCYPGPFSWGCLMHGCEPLRWMTTLLNRTYHGSFTKGCSKIAAKHFSRPVLIRVA